METETSKQLETEHNVSLTRSTFPFPPPPPFQSFLFKFQFRTNRSQCQQSCGTEVLSSTQPCFTCIFSLLPQGSFSCPAPPCHLSVANSKVTGISEQFLWNSIIGVAVLLSSFPFRPTPELRISAEIFFFRTKSQIGQETAT